VASGAAWLGALTPAKQPKYKLLQVGSEYDKKYSAPIQNVTRVAYITL
jgi:hypothetical protein